MSGLTKTQHEFITYCEQYYLLEGRLPTPLTCSNDLNITMQLAKEMLDSEEVVEALKRRGTDKPQKVYNGNVLDARQLALINALLDPMDNRPDRKKLQALQISNREYQAWRSNPAFMEYLHARAEKLFSESDDEVQRALLDRVRSGDTNAIKFYYEVTGRYRPGAQNEVDMRYVLAKIVEVVQRHVTDPTTLAAIGNDLAIISGKITTQESLFAKTRTLDSAPVVVDSEPKEITST